MNSVVKQVWEDSEGMVPRARIRELLTPRYHRNFRKWNKQRIQRGWSDRDTWGAGEHILEMTAGMLRFLDREQNPIDWDEYFKANYKQVNGYESLSEVASDIEQYLEFELTSWADDLELASDEIKDIFKKRQDGNYEFDAKWVNKKGRVQTEKQITARINKWHKAEQRSYKKCQKAMTFVVANLAGLWW